MTDKLQSKVTIQDALEALEAFDDFARVGGIVASGPYKTLRRFILEEPTAQPAEPARPSLTKQLQQQCTDWGVYWRAPDSHGVVISESQAIELLEWALGVEVEIEETTQPQQSTPAVQPKIPPFIESMHSYKTVWTHLEAEQIEDYGRRCFAAGISAAQQPQQSAAINPTGGTT